MEQVVLRTMLLTFHPDTLELDIDAPDMTLDFGIALLQRAKHLLEFQEKLLLAKLVREQDVANEIRTNDVIRKLKLQ
jgi:hypothetical protein